MSCLTTVVLLDRKVDAVTGTWDVELTYFEGSKENKCEGFVAFKVLEKWCTSVVLGSNVDSIVATEVCIRYDLVVDGEISVDTLEIIGEIDVLFGENAAVVSSRCSEDNGRSTTLVNLEVEDKVMLALVVCLDSVKENPVTIDVLLFELKGKLDDVLPERDEGLMDCCVLVLPVEWDDT